MVIDVGDVLVVTDLFVITHGNNARQVRSITEGVEEMVKEAGGPSPLRIEGSDDRQWVLLDYGPFVVHVFDAERRSLYQLERLWGDCEVLDWQTATGGPVPAAEAALDA
ncbi:MAG: ribosome silencing factor [Acidimicrobiaceae bacterium]|nr:ribosome silencing factor [Acidimicrobiaceae bacterium]MYB85931.1 ribosome silencing factor [Acidimicrobiaceae bacterium]MYH92675.1 ribosome silencing factor [Acidimicrobiaceae bacterium]